MSGVCCAEGSLMWIEGSLMWIAYEAPFMPDGISVRQVDDPLSTIRGYVFLIDGGCVAKDRVLATGSSYVEALTRGQAVVLVLSCG